VAALFALLSSVLWGTADFVGGNLSRRVHPLAVVGVAQALVLPGTAALVLGLGAQHDPSGWLPWGVCAGALSLLAVGAFYEALATGTMGVVAPIAALGVVIPVLLGLLQGERPAAIQIGGIALAVAGVVLASGPELRRVEPHRASEGPRSLLLALLAAVGFGLILFTNAKGSRYSAGMTLLSSRVTEVALLLLIGAVTRRTGGVRPRDFVPLAVIGVLEVSANGLYALSSRIGLVSVVAVFASLYPVTTLLLARFRNGERLERVQLAGVTLAMLGVILLAAG
jgi:drug/metabolite transporter (DMT)-like permease